MYVCHHAYVLKQALAIRLRLYQVERRHRQIATNDTQRTMRRTEMQLWLKATTLLIFNLRSVGTHHTLVDGGLARLPIAASCRILSTQ